MSQILIERQHALGMPLARQLTQTWTTKAVEKFNVQCDYQTGQAHDVLHFTGSGLEGSLEVSATNVKLQVQLSFLAAMLKEQLETKFNEQFDTLLQRNDNAS